MPRTPVITKQHITKSARRSAPVYVINPTLSVVADGRDENDNQIINVLSYSAVLARITIDEDGEIVQITTHDSWRSFSQTTARHFRAVYDLIDDSVMRRSSEFSSQVADRMIKDEFGSIGGMSHSDTLVWRDCTVVAHHADR